MTLYNFLFEQINSFYIRENKDFEDVFKDEIDFQNLHNRFHPIYVLNERDKHSINDFFKNQRAKFIEEDEKEKIKLKELKKERVASEIIESGLIGTYNIEILSHNNLDYSKVQTKGKIIITSIGVTIQTEIPTLGLLRGSYWVEQTNPLKRILVCNVSKGFGEFFTMNLSSKKSAGAFTVMSGSRSETTTFTVTD
jgi:hypothetical protein